MAGVQPAPVFIAIEQDGDPDHLRPKTIGWAAEAGSIGERAVDSLPAAQEIANALAEETRGGVAYVADFLFDEPALVTLFAMAGQKRTFAVKDWMLALSPFGQARQLAAISAAAELRAPNSQQAGPRALHMLEVWREGRRRWEEMG